MNPDIDKLHPYPFERLAALKRDISAPADKAHIALSIGEPQHPAPAFVREALAAALPALAKYPTTLGGEALRSSIARWVINRFNLQSQSIDIKENIIPVSGTREALFAFAQAVVARRADALVVMPNPFYQIYEGAALLAGATPYYLNTGAATGFLPDFDAVPPDIWQRCQLLYVCSPGNPSGAVLSEQDYTRLIALADEYDFIIASDECYSELYPDEAAPPPGLLQVAAAIGRGDYRRCVAFHSLSKRSNLPGLRSGFVAGDAQLLRAFLRYRTYHGCALSLPVQAASAAAWRDEEHVRENRALYREKFAAVLEILRPVLDVAAPQGAFYLWPRTPVDDERFARELFATEHVTVLPGRYLSRPAHDEDPGAGHVRMALVAPLEDCVEAARRVRRYVEGL